MRNLKFKKLKILMISVRSDVGGGPKHVLDLCKGLKLMNPDVEIFIASPNLPPFFIPFKKISKKHFILPERSFSLFSFFKLLYFIKFSNVDIIHSHGRGAGIYSKLFSLFGFKVIHTFHGAHVEDSFRGRLKSAIDHFFRDCNKKNICVSNDEKNRVVELGWAHPQSIEVIHNGVDTKILQEKFMENTMDESRRIFNIPPDKIIFGTLARLTFQKGLDLFLNTLMELGSALESYHFVVAGAGEEKNSLLEKMIEYNIENVSFLGEIENPAVFLKALDGYFSFARWEGFPLSVIEAMSLGLPCLISNVTGHRDFGSMCSFFELDSAEDFLKKIQKMRTAKVGSFPFTLEKMSKETLNLYLSLTP